jgi:hypothetical protein
MEDNLPACLRQTVEEREIDSRGFLLASWWAMAEHFWGQAHPHGRTDVEHADLHAGISDNIFLSRAKQRAILRAGLSAPATATYRCLYCAPAHTDYGGGGFLWVPACGKDPPHHRHEIGCYQLNRCGCPCHKMPIPREDRPRLASL